MGFDVTLDVLSASFKVHKVILAACSDYFRAMFTLDMREASQSSIYLQFLSAPQLEALLHCSYTGSVSLSWNCIFEFTITALKLQYQPSLDLCLGFLQREINPNSCLDVASFAEAFGIVKLLDYAEDYMLRQFQQTARYSHEVAVLHGKLYILGGKKYYGTADTINSLFRYDPLEDSWEELCSMSQARCSFSLVVLEFKLFAIGGQCHPDYLETVEQYCAAVNSWSSSSSGSSPRRNLIVDPRTPKCCSRA
uniref:BTB domain-containing protein n=1 Tax=Knipowitschia caucasica TaxID=637954 RepID=A0AAV2KM58_KNICA